MGATAFVASMLFLVTLTGYTVWTDPLRNTFVARGSDSIAYSNKR